MPDKYGGFKGTYTFLSLFFHLGLNCDFPATFLGLSTQGKRVAAKSQESSKSKLSSRKVAAKSQESSKSKLSSRKVAAKSQESSKSKLSSRKVAAKSQESSRRVAAKSQVKKKR